MVRNQWIPYVKSWAKHHNVSFRYAMSEPQVKIDYHVYKMNGKGIVSDTFDALKSRAIRTLETLRHGRTGLPPNMEKVLGQYGNESIIGITIARHPLSSVKLWVIDNFTQFMNKPPNDILFHLQYILTLSNGKLVTFEKTQAPSLWVGVKAHDQMEFLNVPIDHAISLNELVSNTFNYMGNDKFNSYQATTNNCQSFGIAMLVSNHLATEENRAFTKQDTGKLLDGLDSVRKGLNTITDLGGMADVVIQGGRLKHLKFII
jgi:hypothetical protein